MLKNIDCIYCRDRACCQMKICRAAPGGGAKKSRKWASRRRSVRPRRQRRAHTNRAVATSGSAAGRGRPRARAAPASETPTRARACVSSPRDVTHGAARSCPPPSTTRRARVPPAMWQNNYSAPEHACCVRAVRWRGGGEGVGKRGRAWRRRGRSCRRANEAEVGRACMRQRAKLKPCTC